MAEVMDMADVVLFEDDRRDPAARAVRDRLAERLELHPRELGSLTFEVASSTLGRVEELERRLQRLEQRVTVDELTGALRRGAGHEALVREIDRARRCADQRLVVAFVDVDDLKHVNDTEGHGAGDRLLQDVADILRAHLRSYDPVIRWGGDEFVCVLPEADLESAARHLEEVASTFARITYGHTFSVGFAALGPDDDPEAMIARADAALYGERRRRRGGAGFDR
ncbi:MAG: GGDEF domain-containing protein [Candidatus Dormibacteraceae bacterium]